MDRLYREAADRRARSGAPSPSSYYPSSSSYSQEPRRSYSTSRESSSRPSRGFNDDDALARARADVYSRYPSISRDRAPSRSYEPYNDTYGRRAAVSSYPLDGANPPMPSRSGRQMPLSYETRYGQRSGTYGAPSTLHDSLLTRGFPGGPPRAPEPRYEPSY
ncbi:hypothetical protein LTR56_020950, partial [Elasticomyces elasticus]